MWLAAAAVYAFIVEEPGETEGGVTIHWMTQDVDAGPIAGSNGFPIGPRDDYDDVFDEWSHNPKPGIIAVHLADGNDDGIFQPGEVPDRGLVVGVVLPPGKSKTAAATGTGRAGQAATTGHFVGVAIKPDDVAHALLANALRDSRAARSATSGETSPIVTSAPASRMRSLFR